jgi:hypothetical protein
MIRCKLEVKGHGQTFKMFVYLQKKTVKEEKK